MFEGGGSTEVSSFIPDLPEFRPSSWALTLADPVGVNSSSSSYHERRDVALNNSSRLSLSLSDYPLGIDEDASNESAVFSNETYQGIADFYELLINHNDIKMRDDVLRIATPLVIIVGNLSNMIALFVLPRKKLRKNPACFYMCAYAVANLLILNLMLGVAWFCFTFNKTYVTFLADWCCRLWTFVTNVVTYSGIWFVVALSIDRLLYTTSRLNCKDHCSVFSAKAAVTAIMICLVVVSVHAMWTYELQPHGCYVPFHQEDMHILIWPWWSATVYTYLPLFLIFSINVAHMIALCLSHSRGGAPVLDPVNSESFVVASIIVSMSFFILAVPATATNILDIHMPSSWLSLDVVARMELTKKITELLSSLNHVLIGFQLLACSKEFRCEFVAMVRSVFCCIALKRRFKVSEIRQISNSQDSCLHRQVDYQLCNNHEDKTSCV